MGLLVGFLVIGGIVTAVDRAADSDFFESLLSLVTMVVLPPFFLGLFFPDHLALIAFLSAPLLLALWGVAVARYQEDRDDELIAVAGVGTFWAIVFLLVLGQLAPTYYRNDGGTDAGFLNQWDIPPAQIEDAIVREGSPPIYGGATFDEAVRGAFADKFWMGVPVAIPVGLIAWFMATTLIGRRR